jgi:hypothetical protein
MEEKVVEIPISKETRAFYPHDMAAFEDGLCADLSDHQTEFAELLSAKDPRGTIDGSSIMFDTVEVGENNKATVNVSYVEEAYYGCKDMDKIDQDDDFFRFTFDMERNVMRFSVPVKPERDHDDI